MSLSNRLDRLERTARATDDGPVIYIPHNGRGDMPTPSETWPVVVYDPADPPPEMSGFARSRPGDPPACKS